MILKDFGEITRQVNFRTGRGEQLPPQLAEHEAVRQLFDLLPATPHIMVGSVGNLLAHDFSSLPPSQLPKRADLDLMTPAMILSPPDWQELIDTIASHNQSSPEPADVTCWDDGQIIIVQGSSVCFLGPEYANLSPADAQQRFATVYHDQVVDRNNCRFHTVSTGEPIVFVGQNIGNYNNPKDDGYPGLYADVYPLIILPGEDENLALYKRGFLPRNGAVRIFPDSYMFALAIDDLAGVVPSQLDTSYLSQSPQHAIQFLRRLTKNTISMFKHRGFSDPLPAVLNYYDQAYQATIGVLAKYRISPEDNSSLASLNRKIKKLDRVIKQENDGRSIFNLRQQLTFRPRPVGPAN